jgi:hypothetical protein
MGNRQSRSLGKGSINEAKSKKPKNIPLKTIKKPDSPIVYEEVKLKESSRDSPLISELEEFKNESSPLEVKFFPRIFIDIPSHVATLKTRVVDINSSIESTHQLTSVYADLIKKSTMARRSVLLRELAIKVIEQFSRYSVKTPALMMEIIALGGFPDSLVIHKLLSVFLDQLSKAERVDVDLLSGLADLLELVDLKVFENQTIEFEDEKKSILDRVKTTALSGLRGFLQDTTDPDTVQMDTKDEIRIVVADMLKRRSILAPPPSTLGLLSEGRYSNINLLIKLLGTVLQQYSSFHTQGEKTQDQEIEVLRALCRILDAMRDVQVIDLDAKDLRNPAYQLLISRANATTGVRIELSLYANYAIQALLRIPQNLSPWAGVLTRGKALVEIISGVKKFWDDWDFSQLEGIYKNAKEVFHLEHQAQPWYEALRVAQMLIRARGFQELEEYLYSASEKGLPVCLARYEAPFQIGLTAELDKVIRDSESELSVRKCCLSLLAAMFCEQAHWYQPAAIAKKIWTERWSKKAEKMLLYYGKANHAEYAQEQILKRLVSYLPDPDLRLFAQASLLEIRSSQLLPQLQRLVELHIPKFIELIQIKPKAAFFSSVQLLTEAKREAERSLNWKLDGLRSSVLSNEVISRELSAYVGPYAHRRGQEEVQGDLLEDTLCFLNLKMSPDEKKEESKVSARVSVTSLSTMNDKNTAVYLLLGGAGSGKSTYGRFLERHLWENFIDESSYIPLWISLSTVKRLDYQLIETRLQELGFIKEHIRMLKEPQSKYRFLFILDGYDEINTKINLYQKNALQQWPGSKVIISCRPEFLDKDYLKWFIPSETKLNITEKIHERWIAPFNESQQATYLERYIEQSKKQAKKMINYGLAGMIGSNIKSRWLLSLVCPSSFVRLSC